MCNWNTKRRRNTDKIKINVMAEDFLHIKPQTQEAQKTLCMINIKKIRLGIFYSSCRKPKKKTDLKGHQK